MNYSTSQGPQSYNTGDGSGMTSNTRNVTEKEKVDIWYINQLEKMSGDDGYIFLIVSFPLLESIIRHELKIPDGNDVAFSDNSPALHWLASFLSIPDEEARDFWDKFRNGLLHRGMIKLGSPYSLEGGKGGRPAEIINGITHVYVWDFRDALVQKLRQHHRNLFKDSASLPKIYKNKG